MDIKTIIDYKYSWYCEKVDEANIYFKGSFRYENNYFNNGQACQILAKIFNVKNLNHSISLPVKNFIKENVLKLRGHFSFIIDGQDFVLAFVDKICSHPVFYSNKGNTLFIANSATKLQSEAGLYDKDETSFIEFEMAGYVTGNNTLFGDLFQLQAGEFLLFDKKLSNLEVVRYYRYWPDEIFEKTEGELLNDLHKSTVKTFSEMVETLDGRPVWIPLSGGLDSRLVLAMLHEMKYDNISTFSYGIPGYWEVKQAKRIAEYLKVKWHYIPFEPKKIKNLFYTTERKDYFDFASGLSTVPFLPDFYALQILRKKNIISDDAIIINGQSGDYLTGGHIPTVLREVDEKRIDVGLLLKSIIDKHFSLWLNLKTEENLTVISNKILYLLRLTPDLKLSKSEFAKYYELYEWQERQSKYVVNGQRAYDWFGYDWRLPLWSNELMDFWVRVDWRKKYAQTLYKKYLKQYNITGVFNIKSLPQPPYMPFFIKVLNKIFPIISRVTAKDTNLYNQKYLRYFMSYSPFYPQKKYLEYLKDSQWHRNCVSYLARYYLNNFKHFN